MKTHYEPTHFGLLGRSGHETLIVGWLLGYRWLCCRLAVRSGGGGEPAAEASRLSRGADEVTLKGVMMLEEACTLKPAKDADKTMVLFALEGTPEVAATLDAIMKENWPGDSMDGDQARDLNDAFGKRLKYYFTPGELTTKNLGSGKWGNPPDGRDRHCFRKRWKEMDHAQQDIRPISR